MDVFGDELDLGNLGFEGVEPATIGRPAYHPGVLLKLYIYGYALKSKDGRAAYALRKQTVEPVFGIIKSVMGLSISDARFGERPERMDAGSLGMESETHGRIAPAVRIEQEHCNFMAKRSDFSQKIANPSRMVKLTCRAGSSPTGC
jgi:hypothetical protein